MTRAEYQREWAAKNREKRRAANAAWVARNPEKRKQVADSYAKRAYAAGKTKQWDREKKRAWEKKKWAEDAEFRMVKTLRLRLRQSLRKDSGARSSALILLGMELKEFRIYIQGQFQPGMSWKNWGFGGSKWHLDHVQPIATFDLSSPEQVRQCFHWSNHQPLWQKDNFAKGARKILL
jgi:hypothetical protein